MKTNLIITAWLLIVSCSLLIISAPVQADKLQDTNETYTIYNVINYGGMKLEDTNNTYLLRDTKGEAVGGRVGAGVYIFTPGLFGLMLTGEVDYEPPTAQLVDDGRIRKTNIVRSGNDLVITWDYDSLGPINVEIQFASELNAQYQAMPMDFSFLTSIASGGAQSYTHVGAAYDGNNNYYRVLPDPLVPATNIFDPQNNSITVGKIEIAVPANKYDFIALPFMEDSYLLTEVIGDQLGSGGVYYFWDADTQTNPGAAYAGGTWTGSAQGLTTELRLGDGFYVRAKADCQLALVGRFGTLKSPLIRALKPKNQYNLIAWPFPTNKIIDNMGVSPEGGTDIYEWESYEFYKGAIYSSGTWSDPAIALLQLNRPRFYRPIADLNWNINP